MSDPKILLAFRQVEALKDLSPEVQDVLAGFAAFRPIRKGETLFCQGEPSPYCFGILTGEVTITPAGESANVLAPGRLIGGHSLLGELTRPGLGSVTQDGQLLSIWASRFRTWVETQRSAAGDPPILDALRGVLTDHP